MNSLLLNYRSLNEFNKKYRKGLLGAEHLESGKKHFQKFYDKKTRREIYVDYWAYVLIRGGVKYLIDLGDKDPKQALPIIVLETEEVAHGGNAYKRIIDYAPAKFKSEKKMSFRKLVNNLSSLDHSNPTHKKLLMLMALAQYMSRANFRICSPPSAGKNSSLELLKNTIGDCSIVGKPTMAKLEYKTSSQWLVIDEMMKLNKENWSNIEQFLLSAGDFKNDLEKHSRSFQGSGESFDISELSLSIFYNDVTEYSGEEYFDTRAHGAVLDRFPALRVHGGYTERFDKINSVNVKELVEENYDLYKDIIYSIIYYKDNLESELNRYDTSLLHSMMSSMYPRRIPQRHRDNLSSLLKAIDLYSESQDEFNAWITIVLACVKDYQDMLSYDSIETRAKKRLGNDWYPLAKMLDDTDTYTERIAMINSYQVPVKQGGDVKGLWD